MANSPDTPSVDAQRFADEIEHGTRHRGVLARWLIPAVAACWSLFQLSLPVLIRLNSDVVRTIHLMFAISLVYLCFPALKKHHPGWRALRWLGERKRVPVPDLVLMLLAALAASYYILDYEGIMMRQNVPSWRDYLAGITLIVLLLEAARRALGPALPIVATCFMLLCFVGERLPGILAFRNVAPSQLLTQLTMTTEGIYGVPLDVSANMVFLFVLFGAMLEKSGGGRYFVRLAFSLLGGFRGGPAKAAVLASGLTGLVSGSSIANTVTTGTFTIPLMKKAGYPAEKAAAIEVAASTNGQLMPPIMGAAAFIIAERCRMEYLEVVKAAFVPAVISYIALIYITHLEAAKLGLKGVEKADLPRFWPTLLGGLHFLVPLTLLIVLLVQRFSPQYAAFWAIVALAVMILLVDQATRWRGEATMVDGLKASGKTLWAALVAGGRNMMGIGVAVAAAGIIVGIMTLGPGGRVTGAVSWLSGGNLFIMLVMTAGISLILGMGLPTTANYIVVSTVVAPAIALTAANAGLVVPVIAIHLYCFFFGILADDTPPVGLAAYAASAIAKSKPIQTGIQGFTYDLRTAILPFMFFFNTDLLLIGVTSVWRAALIFGTGVLAMLAFTSLIQRFVLMRNAWYDNLLLAASTWLILRPRTLHADLPILAYTVGTSMFALVIAAQMWRQKRGDPDAAAGGSQQGVSRGYGRGRPTP